MLISRYHILVVLVTMPLCLHGQTADTTFYPSFFEGDNVLRVSLYFDISQHIRKSEEYSDGAIVVYDAKGDSVRHKVRCKARGNYRRDNCFFPPVMLNFKPDTLFTTDGYLTKMKLVSHCVNSKAYLKYLYKEYLVYKLWEQLSPYALRTRLLDVQYFDEGKKGKHYRVAAFIIEPMYMMAQRTNSAEVKGEYFNDAVINELDADRVAFFNYMIGNTDWRIKSAHNIKFIKSLEQGREEVTAIPYDFDHAGLINAAYAKPSEWSRATKVTERDYIGRCRSYNDNYLTLIEEFLAAEEQIYATILDFEYLDEGDRKDIYRYISSFYKELKRGKSFIRMLHNNCMNRY